MNSSKFFLSTLIAAAAMTAPAYAAGEIISLNFGIADNEIGENSTGTAGLATTSDESYVDWRGWTNITGNTEQTLADIKNYDGALIADASVTARSDFATWGPKKGNSTVNDALLGSYYDLANHTPGSWNVEISTSFLACDVYLYFSGDGGQYGAVSVDGVYYKGDVATGTTIKGEGAWGDRSDTASANIKLGTNALTISGASGNLSLTNEISTKNRATLAGIQVVNTSVQQTVTLSGGENLTWSGSQFGGSSWKNASAVNGWTYADITLDADSNVSVTESVSTAGILASGTGALTFNEGVINMFASGKISAGEGTSITFNNTLNFANDGSISGNVSFGKSAKVNVNGGSLVVSGLADDILENSPSITIAQGAEAKLVYKPGKEFAAIAPNVTGEGTLFIAKDHSSVSQHDRAVKISDDFKGVLKLSGHFMPGNIDAGGASSITLAGVWFWSQGSANITKDVLMEGTGNYTNSGTVAFEGKVSGSLFSVQGGTVSFDNQTTLNQLSVQGGTVSISGSESTVSLVDLGAGSLTGNGVSIKTLKFGVGDGVTTSTVAGTLYVENVSQASSGAKDYDKLKLSDNASLTITGTLGTTNNNANDFSQVAYDLELGAGAILSAGKIAQGNGLKISLGENAKVEAKSLVLNNVWNNKTHVFKGAGAEESTLSFDSVSLNGSSDVSVSDTRLNIGTDGIQASESASLSLSGVTLGIREDANSWSSNVGMTLSGAIVANTDRDKSIELSGKLSEGAGQPAASLTKLGAGTLTLSGDNSYSGGTTVQSGILVAAHASALGTGMVEISSGAQLKVENGVELNATTINVVLDQAYTNDTYAVSNNVNPDATPASTDSTTAGTLAEYTTILISGDIEALETAIKGSGVISATYCISNLAATTIGLDEEFKMSLGQHGWGYELSSLYGCYTTLKLTIPEPSVFGLLAGLGALAFAGTRRRRRR